MKRTKGYYFFTTSFDSDLEARSIEQRARSLGMNIARYLRFVIRNDLKYAAAKLNEEEEYDNGDE